MRGSTITLTADGSDDFGIKRVRFADGAATLGTATLPPYTQTATIPADAACGSTRTYSAVVMDSIGQTVAASAPVTVSCEVEPEPTATATPTATASPGPVPVPAPAPAGPSALFLSWPSSALRSVEHRLRRPAHRPASSRSTCSSARA